MEVIPKCMKGLSSVKGVLEGEQNAALGQLTSGSVTVEISMFMSLKSHLTVTSVTVAMEFHLHQVLI